MKTKILVLHGPNLNLLGRREPQVYGSETLEEIDRALRETAAELGVEVEARQSNDEARLIEWIQEAPSSFHGLILNPAGFTHTSVALADAVAAAGIPTVEVHLSNIHAREPFRRRSFVAAVARGQIAGFGKQSYLLALRALVSAPEPPGRP